MEMAERSCDFRFKCWKKRESQKVWMMRWRTGRSRVCTGLGRFGTGWSRNRTAVLRPVSTNPPPFVEKSGEKVWKIRFKEAYFCPFCGIWGKILPSPSTGGRNRGKAVTQIRLAFVQAYEPQRTAACAAIRFVFLIPPLLRRPPPFCGVFSWPPAVWRPCCARSFRCIPSWRRPRPRSSDRP